MAHAIGVGIVGVGASWCWAAFEESTRAAMTPREKLIAFFEALESYAATPACHGCPFLNVASEYPEPDHPGHQVAAEHKRGVRARFHGLARKAGAREPSALADALVLLMDGAYQSARLFGASPDSPVRHLAEAARQLIEAQPEPP
jgi:hypothetical protein